MEVQCIGSYTKYRKHMLFNMVTHTMSNVIWRVYSPLWTDINLNNANNPINPKGPHLAERICRLMSCAACARPQMSAPHHQPSPALSTLACPRRSVVHWQNVCRVLKNRAHAGASLRWLYRSFGFNRSSSLTPKFSLKLGQQVGQWLPAQFEDNLSA